MNSTISIITLNANSLNTPIKRQIIRYQSRLKDPNYMLSTITHFK